jgi:hypothetical protein
MWGRLNQDGKTERYVAVGVVSAILLMIGGAWLMSGRLMPWVPTQQAALNRVPIPEGNPASQLATVPANTLPSSAGKPVQQATSEVIASQPDPKAIALRQGNLRISNPTDYPVRIALLAKSSTKSKSSQIAKSATGSSYESPAHWDFAPQEGSAKGLIVSLPDHILKVKPGDILVAFAQDGSRQYWGPYVVGETEFPIWNAKTGEWQVILQP